MQPFDKHTGISAPLRMINVDTDMIIPKQFLKTIKRTGLGVSLFHELRYDEKGAENPDFVLNQTKYRNASVLVVGDNFGCGSSREHAPWALLDFGIRVIIAPSFADIFYNNCFENGILPITLPAQEVEQLMDEAENGNTAGGTVAVDLAAGTVTSTSGRVHNFELHPAAKDKLLRGIDSIGVTLALADKIAEFEQRQSVSQPWL